MYAFVVSESSKLVILNYGILKFMKYTTAVVTGASRGLGRAIGIELAHKGLNVMLAARAEN
ncbi:MAG TPA: SDR family NAD(P)-dependent oxidoreductase, partial [Acidobacteriota bacterium]